MFDKISYTWEVMGASWNILKKDTSLILFPLFSGIACFLVILSFALPVLFTGVDIFEAPAGEDPAQQALRYTLMFAFYFCNYFVITFFNVGITACAVSQMAGGTPSFSGGMREAFKRIHLILGWAFFQATVGFILRLIEERSKFAGKIVAAMLGSAFTIVSAMVVPILVVEEKGPIAAFKESGKLLGKTWGEQLVGNFSFGIIFFLLALPGIGMIVVAIMSLSHNPTLMLSAVTLGVVYILVLNLIGSALRSIFQAALYMYTQGAIEGGSRGAFPVKLLKGSMA